MGHSIRTDGRRGIPTKMKNLLANLAALYYFHDQTQPSSLMTPGALSFDDPMGFDVVVRWLPMAGINILLD
jgi:hypothetical protein